MDYKENVSKRLQMLMRVNDVNSVDVANACDLPSGSVSRYLNGVHNPKLENLIKLANYFHVSVDWLLGANDSADIGWDQQTIRFAQRYSIASDEDKKIVEYVLQKYSIDK